MASSYQQYLRDTGREDEIQEPNIIPGSQPTEGQPAEGQPTTEGFPGPERDTTSQVDLSIEANKQVKDNEHNIWWNMPNRIDGQLNPERQQLKNQWYLKYYGQSAEELKYADISLPFFGDMKVQKGGFYPGANDPSTVLQSMAGLSIPGLATADFGMDAVGLLPGGAELDDKWDEWSKTDNELHTGIRRVLSVVIPAIHTGGLVTGGLQKLPTQMPRVQKILVGMGAFSAQEAAIIGISDEGEEHNSLRVLSDFFPGVFGEKGMTPIPEWAKTLDSDSASVRRWKNMWDTTVLSIMGTVLGSFIKIKGGQETLGWLRPKDNLAEAYKAREILNRADPDKLIRIQEINTVLSTKQVSRSVEASLIDELTELKETLGLTDDIEDAVRELQENQIAEAAEAGARKSQNLDPTDLNLDYDVTPLGKETGEIRQSVPPGNIARNIADTTAIKSGISKGDPAPVITESMRTKGLMVGSTSRDAVLGVAEEARELGRFDALVDGFRFTSKQMDTAAWSIYESIIAADSMDEVRDLFLKDKDIKNMLSGKFKVEYINEEQARGIVFSLRDLTDRFLGRHIARSSARVMDTLGREVTTMSQAVQELQPFVDDDAAMDLVIDKMQFLLDEYALNKYISGWQLRNKNWFDAVPPENIDEALTTLVREFRDAENAIHAKNLRFTATLKELADTNPLAMRPLMDAFAESRGDVDTLDKLMRWAADKVTPMGMLKSPDPKKLNAWTKGAWGIRYNNVLSGLSAFRAGLGNGAQLILKPITAVLGHGIWGAADGFEGLKRTIYYNGALFETNRRALSDAFEMMKRAHKDPEMMIKAFRKDFVIQDQKELGYIKDMLPVWRSQGNWGREKQAQMTLLMHDLAKAPGLRYGMTGMVFPDAFTWTHMAHYLSRARAYDDVFSEFGFADWKKIAVAEKKHYATMFDSKTRLPTDKVLRSLSGEVALNLDDGLATWINQGTTAYPVAKELFMFPRTQSNVVKNASSWTPLTLIPGFNKYSKVIYAGNNEANIIEALAEHGIDYATTPNAQVIFENLRAEYTGRIAFGTLLAGSLWQYSMSGNIRGNGHYNASRRAKERNQFGYEPKTINIGGKWVSYKGVIGVEQVLSIVGDMAYYKNDITEAFLEDWTAKLSWTIAASFLHDTPLQGVEPLIAALNGDLTAFNRMVANMARGWIPMSSGLGVLSDAISSTQKDIQGEIHEYVLNRMPGLSTILADQIDVWTGEPLNDIDNPFLKVLNAMSPVKVSGTNEPWRVWLRSTGWGGLSKLNKDPTGSYTYSTSEREAINKLIGSLQLHKKLKVAMNNKEFNKQIQSLQKHRISGADLENERIRLKAGDLPVNKYLNKLMSDAHAWAHAEFLRTAPEEVRNSIQRQIMATSEMKSGNVEGAVIQQQVENQEYQNLIQMPK